jgi:uncharacterized membrane protein
MVAIAYNILQRDCCPAGRKFPVRGGDRKRLERKTSPALYFSAIPLAFVSVWISIGLRVFVALMWLVPDRRIERVLVKAEKND